MDGCIARVFASTALALFSGAFLILPSQTVRISDTHLCSNPLGMQSLAINDSDLSASSSYFNTVGPSKARLNTENAGGAWCPKDPISVGSREWLQVSLKGTHLLSGVQLQGRFGHGRGQEYTEEFEIEYWRQGMQHWRKYYRFDGKTVLPGNSDTSTVVTTKLLPPLLAEKIRILPYAKHRRTVCIRMELLGCPITCGVSQYVMEQGHTFSEGISLRDESYDGQGTKWDRTVIMENGGESEQNLVNVFHSTAEAEEANLSPNDINFHEVNRTTEEPEQILSDGLGQLTDTIEGPNSFTMDIAYGLGNGWVGWKRKQFGLDYVEILFEFDVVREFSTLDLYSNNYPSKDVQIFARAKVYFSVGGVFFNGKPVTYVPPVTDGTLTLEHARNLTIPLESRIARFVKIHLHFRSSWILLGEAYFNSEIYDGNYTLELRPDSPLDFPDTQSPLEIGDLDSSMVETVVGIISGLILLLSIVAGLIIWMRRNGRSISSAFQFHGSAFPFWRNTWSSVPTHIVTQTNPATEGVKDLLLTLTPLSNGGGGNAVVVNGDFKAHNPPPYTNGSVTPKNSNGLQLQGTHHNNYGSVYTKKEKGGSLSAPEYSTTTLTLRSNQLAAVEEPEYEDADDESVYKEASTLTINNSTLRTRNRKLRTASCVWNLSSGGGRSYRNHRGRLVPEVSLRQLRLIENLGSCLYGQVHLYDFEGEIACHEGTLYRNCRIIAKTIKSMSEIRLLSVLDHEHVLAMIAVCSEMKKPLLALYPAPECGDLCSFLSRLSNTPSLSWLLSVGAQIASGMNYLESLSLIHRDLAARNCLVEREGSIRISDLAMACEQYRGDYCHTSRGLAPLRWWSWESILTDEFTMHSSVWSFGVTLWEILTLCRQKPLAHVPDHQISTLAEKYGSSATNQQVWLPQPLLSPPEIFDLMRECWQKNPPDRPTFQHIHLFLEQKCSTTIYHAV